MKKIKLFLKSSLLIGAFAWCYGAVAQLPTVGVHRTGPANIYKGGCMYHTTTFTISAANNYGGVEVYLYIGGEGDGQNSTDISQCWAASQHNGNPTPPDFIVSGTGLTVFSLVPHLYELVIPAGHSSGVITCTTTNTANRCDGDYSTLQVYIPPDYSDEYNIDGSATNALANLYPGSPPSISVSVSPATFPFSLTKSTGSSTSFTLNASQPFPGPTTVLVFVGGQGDATSPVDPCYAISPDDFTVSGYSTTAPFPHGFLVNFNEGDSSKTLTVTAVDNPSDCDGDYQTLLVTVPTVSGCTGYSPGYPSQISANEYP